MSVIIRLQNLPWSANALDIRNYFRGLSIPEGGVHIVGGELGDAFIAFSTDEDARQAMMLDCGKIKEIQVKLLLSSRSEMHKVIEAARQTVPILTLTAPAAPVAPAPVVAPPTIVAPVAVPTPPLVTPFSAVLGNSISNFGIPGIGNPQEIPQPAVIEPPAPMISPPVIITPEENDKDDEKSERKRSKEKDRRKSRSRSRSRDRDRKDRKRDRRDRSRSRDRDRKDRKRDRRDRSRSRDRRRRDRSRSRDRSPSRRSRDRRNNDLKPPLGQEKPFENQAVDALLPPPPPAFNTNNPISQIQLPPAISPVMQNGPAAMEPTQNRFTDPSMADTYNKLHELGKKRNPSAFQGEQQNGAGRFTRGRGGVGGRGGGDGHMGRGAPPFRRDARQSRFENEPQRDCCVAIKNAPNHTSYGDVRRFFPFMIDKHGIKMINDNMGRRTGNIFVRFCDSRSKHLALQRKNNELKGAEVIVESLEDEGYEAAIDSFLPYREENDDEDQSLVIMDSDETTQPEFSVLKLTDLPHFVKEHDIIKTFSDFSLLSIMVNDCRVTRSKTAYVQFAKSADARQALEQKERYIFGRRHPTIVAVTDEEYEKEKINQNEREPEVQAEPIAVEPPPLEREPAVPRDPRQRRPQFDNGPLQQAQPTQAPYFPAQFGQGQPFAPPFAAQPFGAFPGNAMDPRTAAANWANRPTFPNPMPAPARNHNIIDLDDEPLDCVLMKGLPSETTDRTIVTFLSDTGAVPARIHLMLDANSRPSGDCFCEFRTTQEARMAATKHGHDLEGNRVTVDLVTRGVVEDALEGPKQVDVRNSPTGLLGNGPPQPQFFDAPRGGYQPRGTYRGRGYDRGFDRGGYRGRGEFDSARGFDSGRRFDSGRGGFDSGRGGFDSGRGGFDSGRGGFDSGRGFRGRGSFDRGNRFDRGRGRGFSRGRGGFDSGRGGFENGRDREMREEEQDPALEDFGAPGCVASMENVPFRATVDDIMNFFSEFELTQDDIIRRYNERGQPTGDARVAFRTPFDAQRAVKTRHMDTIYDRRINLTIL